MASTTGSGRFHACLASATLSGWAHGAGWAPASPRSLGLQAGDGLLLRIETNRGIPARVALRPPRRRGPDRAPRLRGRPVAPTSWGSSRCDPSRLCVRLPFVPLRRPAAGSRPARAREHRICLRRRSRPIGVRRSSAPRSSSSGSPSRTWVSALRPLAVDPTAWRSRARRVLLDEAGLGRAAFGRGRLISACPRPACSATLRILFRASGPRDPVFGHHGRRYRRGALPPVRPRGSGSRREPATAPIPSGSPSGPGGISASPVGVTVEIDYYRWQDDGTLVTRTARFRACGSRSPWARCRRDLGARCSRHHRGPEYPRLGPAVPDGPSPHSSALTRTSGPRYRATPKALDPLATDSDCGADSGAVRRPRLVPRCRPDCRLRRGAIGLDASSPVVTLTRSRSPTTRLDEDGIAAWHSPGSQRPFVRASSPRRPGSRSSP